MRRIKYTFLLCLIIGLSFQAIGQENKKILKEINSIAESRNERVKSFLESNAVQSTIVKGKVIHEIYDIVAGKPVYRSTDNSGAANDTKTSSLQPGGSLGLSLEGENMVVGVWEVGGITRITHAEFNEGNESRVILSDSNTNETFHSTHVTGTIAGNGTNPDAKGMASKATIWCYDVTNVESELSIAATDNNFLLSNHSYGVAVEQQNGNTIPANIMGAYTNSARQWDLIANAAPYHLSVFAAGNSGNEEYEGGLAPNYDKLTYEKNSKNNMVVANVASVTYFGSLVISNVNSSSSRGPSDDGRIKPDIGAMGTNILSAAHTADDAYGTATGTSMASPGVAGSLLLLQELYNNEFGEYLKSSTIKALALNTASDAGNTGPDATYGWGILNTEKAANTILNKSTQNSIISLQTLDQGETITFDITAEGTEDIKVMIGWNDPAGTAINNTVNSPTPALVNDIDLRVKLNQETYMPWKLQLSDVTAPAIKGDNTVDNYEQVIVQNPIVGNVYTVEITHKGNLVNQLQEVSVIATGISSTTLSNETFNRNLALNYWPNPADNYLNISFNEAVDAKNGIVRVYDLMGKQVISEKIINHQTSSFQLDVSRLIRGTYIMNITTERGSYNTKFIKK